ncbi:MAG: hypothetical protein DRI32_09515, partial [Chloroflexi bacterium]
KGCWNFPHPFDKLRTMPDLSLRSGRPSPKAGEGKFSPILGEVPEGQRGRRKINQQLFSAPSFCASRFLFLSYDTITAYVE